MNIAVISERIRQKRKANGLTQAGLAELLGMSDMTVRRWETGKSSPRIEEIQQIAKTLQTSVEYLMGEKDSEEQEQSLPHVIESPVVNSKVPADRIVYNYGNHHFDLPATPDGYKAFRDVLVAMTSGNVSSLKPV